MAMYQPTPISIRWLKGHMLDISTANSLGFVVVPWKCKLLTLGVTLHVAITTGDSVVTCSRMVNGVASAITGGVITAAFTGSAAGSTFEATPTVHTYLDAGDAIKFDSDGGSTVVCSATCFAIVDLMNN
jgi:hypothetical protein